MTAVDTATRPDVRVMESVIVINCPTRGVGYFNRNCLSTAYLLLLDSADVTGDNATSVRDALVNEHGFDPGEALRCLLAAALLIRHNIDI